MRTTIIIVTIVTMSILISQLSLLLLLLLLAFLLVELFQTVPSMQGSKEEEPIQAESSGLQGVTTSLSALHGRRILIRY